MAAVTPIQGLAADDHPGEGGVTGQSPAGFGFQRPGPADVPTDPARLSAEAVEVDDHAELGPDPTGDGELAALQGPAGQLGQGVGGALTATAGVGSIRRARQRVQGSQQGLAGFGGQEAADGHHLVKGGSHPHPRRA